MSTDELERELPGGGRVLFTERLDGNMSSVGGEEAELAQDARERLRARIAVAGLVRGYQEHGTLVRRVGSPARGPSGELRETDSQGPPADGQATALTHLGMMVLAADCMPVALGCEGAVAMVHAGWRGLAAGVLEQGVLALGELAGGETPITAIVGPCAGVCCYEVGPEVHAAFGGAHRVGDNLDLRAIAHERLLAAGVGHVGDVQACTICHERFFSHRREGTRAGRQAGVAWLS
jgi:polyphenol oxidase